MITNLDLKLNGSLPVTRDELFILVDSWGRKDSFNTFDDIIIEQCTKKEKYDLSNLDVSQIDCLSEVFKESLYDGDLSNWNVSNCINMNRMFCWSSFNNDSLKNWDVSNVKDMNMTFFDSLFNGNISSWNIYNVKSFDRMFQDSIFDRDISSWNFNENVDCYKFIYDNQKFYDKYNNGKGISIGTKKFLEWFKNNRENIKEINNPKEEVLDFFSFDSNLNKDIK